MDGILVAAISIEIDSRISYRIVILSMDSGYWWYRKMSIDIQCHVGMSTCSKS